LRIATLPPRKMLTLEVLRSNSETQEDLFEVVSNLKSPLGLALILIDSIFTDDGEGLKEYSNTLDETKKIAFGLGSAEKLAINYSDHLAMYGLYQFAFQQFVQSSFRARQGKALEEIMKRILGIEEMRITPTVASSKKKKIEILKRALNNSVSKTNSLLEKHDIDILAESGSKTIIFQMRSRDDTGGATAKPSLAELLRDLYREELSNEVLYVIYTWVKPKDKEPPQKVTLINKLLSMIDLEDEEIKRKLMNGTVVQLKDNLKLCVVYGAEELIRTLWADFGISIDGKYEALIEKYKNYLEILSSWDDLWMSYAVATIELENLIRYGKTNVNVINKKLLKLGHMETISSEECVINYEKCSENIAKDIATAIRGREDLTPFNSVGEKITYIRDLLLLKIVYEHMEDIIPKVKIDNSTRKRIKKISKSEGRSEA